ncbi:adaptor complexes medium subunit family [Plasmodium sp. gorilla clade G3]|nr:adaptor complexes medium subunit family [Plasmodium sp. gorilla clade G3]
MLDLFCIYSSNGKLLIEQCFNKKRYKRNIHNVIKRILYTKTNNNNDYYYYNNYFNNNVDNNYYLILNNTSYDYKNDKLHLLNGRILDNKKFVYIIKNDELYFVTLIEGENNPILIVEMMQEIIKIIKKYFVIDKLKENILIHNYTIINFLINEILVQSGKPSLFIHTILKELINYDNNNNNNYYYNSNYNTSNNFLNETLKIGPIPNNIYNMITQNKYININVGHSNNNTNNISNNNNNNNLLMLNINNEKNINYSYSNGSYLNGKHSIYNYWRSYNNTSTSSNEIYIDVEENVNCIVNKNNKIIHYYIQGNVYINSNINGSPYIKLYFNQLDVQKCNFHYTINSNKLFYKNKDEPNLNNKNVIIHFVPLHEKYCLLHYYDKILLHPGPSPLYNINEYHNKNNIKSNTYFNDKENINSTLTNVLKLSSVEDTIKENEISNEHCIKNEDGNVLKTNYSNILQNQNTYSFETFSRNTSYEENMNVQYNISSSNKYIEYNNDFQFNNLLNILNDEHINIPQGYFDITNDNSKNSYDNNLFSHPKYKLPILIKGNIHFVSTENMYKIKLNVLLNNINTNKNNSNILLNRYENILIKIPIHHFIKSVNFHTSLGNINYNEKKKCIYWFINYVTDMNTQICANISLYVPTHEENEMNQIKNTYQISPLNNFNLYPLFNFVAYASLKINGVSITDHKIEKIEIQDLKNMEIRKGCRYSTIYNNIEFRL